MEIKTLLVINFILSILFVLLPTEESENSKEMNDAINRYERQRHDENKEPEECHQRKKKYWKGFKAN